MSDTTSMPAASPTLGQTVDAKVALLEARLNLIEADAKTDWSKAVAWVKAQWPHFVTWAGTAAVAVKAFGLHL